MKNGEQTDKTDTIFENQFRKQIKYLKRFCQFEHVYEESYQFAAAHLSSNYEVGAVVEHTNLQTKLCDLKNASHASK